MREVKVADEKFSLESRSASDMEERSQRFRRGWRLPLLRKGGLCCHEGGRALVKRLGRAVSKVDWTITFDFVVTLNPKR